LRLQWAHTDNFPSKPKYRDLGIYPRTQADSGFVANDAVRRLLERCFKPAEFEWLNARSDFQLELASTLTLPDLEKTVTLGHHLLLERDGIYFNSPITLSKVQP
jgi:hypothetical protein